MSNYTGSCFLQNKGRVASTGGAVGPKQVLSRTRSVQSGRITTIGQELELCRWKSHLQILAAPMSILRGNLSFQSSNMQMRVGSVIPVEIWFEIEAFKRSLEGLQSF